jgi:Putative zinc-finger
MMTCNEVRDRLSLLVDGEVPETERAAIEQHLAGCSACRDLRQDLERVQRTAASLGPINPPDHIWLQVAGQMRLEQPASRLPLRRSARPSALRQWIGIAAALVLTTIASYYFVRGTPPPGNAPVTASVETIAEELDLAMQHYEKAITELETLAKSDPDALDPVMAATLSQNVRTINGAIEESRAALKQNPGSEPARESLFEALRRKVGVLQATVNLMNEMRKGNQVGAVQAAAAFGKS